MLRLPEHGYVSRMSGYLAEMYPIPTRLLASSLLYISIVEFLRSTNRIDTPMRLSFTIVGIGSFFAILLLVRLMDELKDALIDRDLFPDRPLPSGRVLDSDILFSIQAVVALFLAVNLWTGAAVWMALVVLVYALLMYKHFFVPRILRENLLITLATHNIFVPIVYLYIFTLFAAENEIALSSLNRSAALLLISMYWAMSLAWEIARKIRSREEETAYVTYSKTFGPAGAVLIALAAHTASFGIGIYFYWAFSLSLLFLAILASGYAAVIWGYARFLMQPNPANSRLRTFAETFILCVLIAQTLEHGLLR
jgi:4-hydroxybenzoate polyprenyltransferase